MARKIICPTREVWLSRRREGITASEISAILGLSPWLSAFSLYWQKVMGYEQEDNFRMARGRRLEALVREDFLTLHPEMFPSYQTNESGYATLYAHEDRPWQLATPDALIWPKRVAQPGEEPSLISSDGSGLVLGDVMPLELKTDHHRKGWGPSGSDLIPAHYRAQVLWQMDVMDAEQGWLAVWIGLDDYREYLIKRDEEDLAVMRAAGEQFIQRLRDGQPPPIDALASTTTTLKQLHSQVAEDDVVSVADDLADRWDDARVRLREAKTAVLLLENEVRGVMGDAGRGIDTKGRTVATRVVYTRQAYEAKPAIIDRLFPGRRKSV